MERLEPPPARLLLVESSRTLREALAALLARESYLATAVSSLEEALAALEERSYAVILADLVAGASRHSFAPAHILRRRAQPIPMGLITDQRRALERAQFDGFAFALPRPIEVPALFTEIAACLNHSLTLQQQHQAHVVERFLEAYGVQEWKSLLDLCTEEIMAYPSSLFPHPAGHPPATGKLSLLAVVTTLRRRYHSLRIEAQGIYPHPDGLAVRYSGCFAELGKAWEFFGGAELFKFAGERICQIGVSLSYQQRRTLQELPLALVGPGRPS